MSETSRADRDRIRAEARAEAERHRAHVLAELGVTPPEAALFQIIHYGMRCNPSVMPSVAARPDYSLVGRVTEDECRAALAACLANGRLQVVDEAARAEIADELRRGGYLGPIYGGITDAGRVDFTAVGADLWHRIRERSRPGKKPPSAYTDVVHEKTAHYYRTRAAAVDAVEEARGEQDVVSVTGPTPTGPWRAEWWRRSPEGYRVDIEQRRQWQGYCGGGSEECCFRPPDEAEPRRLRDVLDRHNVTPAEWLLLAGVAQSWSRSSAANLARRAAETAERDFGLPATETECRDGLEACRRYGWLRVVDRAADDEVRAVLRDDSAALVVPKTAGNFAHGDIDFSSTGAALYRTLSAAWLGPDWEDGLRVSKGYEWEEHHYCEAADGFDRIAEEHVAKGAVVRGRRVVPIGPWCVYWWERFPAGFRLELDLVDG